MRAFIEADSLAFVTIGGLYRAVGEGRRDPAAMRYCDACFTGDYPIRLTDWEDAANQVAVSSLAGTAT
jgi:amidophosphoribosyltransferase